MKSLRERNEGAYVLATTAIAMPVLLMLMGFAIDLGSWYLRATQLQRSADVAALSGATLLPDTAAAVDAAKATFLKNGLVDDSRITTSVTSNNEVLSTSVSDKKVDTYFLQLLSLDISLTRKAEAKKLSTIPLGNPYNAFGTGDLTIPGIPKQNFWAAVSGGCSPKEDGDYFMARWDGNKRPTQHICPAPDTMKNPSYSPGGYAYAIDIPAGETGAINIDIYDPVYDVIVERADDVVSLEFNTNFVVWDTMGTATESDDVVKTSAQVLDGQSPVVQQEWWTLYTIPSVSVPQERNYRLQVFTAPRPGEPLTDSGFNTYSVMAYAGSGRNGCDSRKAANTCPKVYGLGAVSVFNSIKGVKNEFFLAEVSDSFRGTTLTAYLWDPGEGAQTIELLAPNGAVMPFSWEATPSLPAAETMSGTNVKEIDVGGTGPQPNTGIQGTGKFNDRLITVKFDVPSDYSSYISDPNDYWWKLRYSTDPGKTATDRSTWGLNVGKDTPAYLSRHP